ncbi:MAG: MBL fold metallo-hydrolase [Treponemataceae bacterium]
MKIYFIFSQDKFLNSYLVANEKTNEAIFIDPLKVNIETIKLIDKHKYRLKYVLFTHGDKNMQREGSLSISKIYRGVEILRYQYLSQTDKAENQVSDIKYRAIVGEGKIKLAGLDVEYFSLASLGSGACCYKIQNVIFCGRALVAGQIGETSSDYATQNLQKNLQEKIFKRDNRLLLFPMVGGPTSVMVESIHNIDLQTSFKEKKRRF